MQPANCLNTAEPIPRAAPTGRHNQARRFTLRSAAALRASLRGLLGAGACALLATGCSSRNGDLQGRIELVVGVSGVDQLSYDLIKERTNQINRLVSDFEQLHPGVKVNVGVWREQDFEREVRLRNATGLGPDLMFLSSSMARLLVRNNQVRAVRFPAEVSKQLDDSSIHNMSLAGGWMAGLPVLQEPQVACFDREQMTVPPDSIQGLLESSETGSEIGMALDPVDLYWTAGPLGANQAFAELLEGQPVTDDQRQQIRFWMTWLQNSNKMLRVNFFANEEQLVQGLIERRLDWVPCHSSNMQRLRKRMGRRLGVSVLPGDFAGQATPTTRLRVWAFGVNSSANQRQISESFAAFTVNPLIQRNLTLHTLQMLPVNRFVPPPVGSSTVLKALVEAERQGRATESLSLSVPAGDPRRKNLERLLMRLVFGDLTPDEATAQVIAIVRERPTP